MASSSPSGVIRFCRGDTFVRLYVSPGARSRCQTPGHGPRGRVLGATSRCQTRGHVPCGRSPAPGTSPLAAPAVDRDRDELVDRGLELLLARPRAALAQDRQDLALRAAVHEDDEAEAEPLLVGRVQRRELAQ